MNEFVPFGVSKTAQDIITEHLTHQKHHQQMYFVILTLIYEQNKVYHQMRYTQILY